MKILVTGGAGFIGSAVCRWLIANTNDQVLNLDVLTYAASPASLAEVQGSNRYQFLQADIRDADAVKAAFDRFQPDAVVHLAAESHVDRSITEARSFVETNVVGTFVMLQSA